MPLNFKLVSINPDSVSPDKMQERYKVSWDTALSMSEQALSEQMYISKEYQVTKSQSFPPKLSGWPR